MAANDPSPSSRHRGALARWLLTVALVAGTVVVAGSMEGAILYAVQLGVPLWLLALVVRKRLRAARNQAASAREESWTLRGARTVRAAAVRSIASFGGGFYGTMAAGAFLVYQVRQLQATPWPDVTAWGDAVRRVMSGDIQPLLSDLSGFLWGLFFGVSTDWIQGFVYAMTWPVHVLGLVGVWGLCLVLVGGLYGFKLARQHVPGLDSLATEVRATSPTSAWTPTGAELLSDDPAPDPAGSPPRRTPNGGAKHST
jgi:hypothetical protein